MNSLKKSIDEIAVNACYGYTDALSREELNNLLLQSSDKESKCDVFCAIEEVPKTILKGTIIKESKIVPEYKVKLVEGIKKGETINGYVGYTPFCNKEYEKIGDVIVNTYEKVEIDATKMMDDFFNKPYSLKERWLNWKSICLQRYFQHPNRPSNTFKERLMWLTNKIYGNK